MLRGPPERGYTKGTFIEKTRSEPGHLETQTSLRKCVDSYPVTQLSSRAFLEQPTMNPKHLCKFVRQSPQPHGQWHSPLIIEIWRRKRISLDPTWKLRWSNAWVVAPARPALGTLCRVSGILSVVVRYSVCSTWDAPLDSKLDSLQDLDLLEGRIEPSWNTMFWTLWPLTAYKRI